MNENFIIRNLTREEAEAAADWAALEGWNPGLHDMDSFYSTDPNGFFGGFLDCGLIACISAVSYGECFGFIGFYIVKPKYRGRGFGLKIWRHAMHYMGGRNVGLDGVLAQIANYGKYGFRFAYHNARYAGYVRYASHSGYTGDSGDSGYNDSTLKSGGSCKPDLVTNPAHAHAPGLVKLADVPLSTVTEFDDTIFPVSRPAFLRNWITHPAHVSLGMLDGNRPDRNRMLGYGVIRPCRNGFKIGPLAASSETVAETLFNALTYGVGTQPVFLDVPVINAAAVGFATRHGMEKVFETARMYTGTEPAIALDKLYGVTTFELG
ncbi:MAG: GNAT family N-acetyltransferase [Nitrospirae bacterium]|nr:GNAT family N-acetyltransferase [Nitrospirota bacterium]